MCGRYVLARDTANLTEVFGVDDAEPTGAPGYNVAPTTPVPVVVDRYSPEGERTRLLRVCRWGLVPSWARDTSGAARMINARMETVASRPAFRVALARRRCLVPADGWYEWAVGLDAPGRIPYYLTPRDGSALAFAGLYEVWGTGSRRLTTCAIITTAATGQLARVHHRMPLLLRPDQWSGWLDCRTATPALSEPDPDTIAALELRPVGTEVGNVRNQGRHLVAPVVPTTVATPGQQALDLR
ncbi:MAG TPA: SOS response-associated peptidase [Mycobacteriales bacterium]